MSLTVYRRYTDFALMSLGLCPLWVKTGVKTLHFDVRFTPESGHMRRKKECPIWAKCGHLGDTAPWQPVSMLSCLKSSFS